MTTSLPAPRCPRYASLDFWRGVACLAVVIYHSTAYVATSAFNEQVHATGGSIADHCVLFTKHLWCGVSLFFVISGYCIATVADKQRRRSHGIVEYFRRRLRRIYPPYWICFGLCAGATTVTSWIAPHFWSSDPYPPTHPAALTWHQWIGNLTLTEIWRHEIFGGPAKSTGVLPVMWTLCYEEQFYLVVGLLILLCPRYFFRGAMLVTLLVYVNNWAVHPRVLGLDRLTHWLASYQFKQEGLFWDGNWLDFAVGIGVYYWINHAGRWGRIALPIGFLLALAPEMLPLEKLMHSLTHRQQARLIPVVFGLTLMGLYRMDTRLSQSVLARPIARCGLMCYSLYLVHFPIVRLISKLLFDAGVTGSSGTVLVTIPVCTLASVVAAWGFFMCVERRFLNQPLLTQETVALPPAPPAFVAPEPARL